MKNKNSDEILTIKKTEFIENTSSEEDISLMVDKMKKRDELAFEDFVENFAGFVFGYVRSRVKAEEDVIKQIVLDTFERAFFSIKDFHYNSKKQLMSWLICVCKTVINCRFRKNQKSVPVIYDDELVENYEESRNTSLDGLEILYECADENEVYIVTEHVIKNVPFNTIAQSLSIPPSKVANIYYHTIKKCQRKKKRG